MCDFSDEQDRKLFRLAKVYVDAGKKIQWAVVASHFSLNASMTKRKVASRFQTLNRTHGKDLFRVPRAFHRIPANPPTPAQSVVCAILHELAACPLWTTAAATPSPLRPDQVAMPLTEAQVVLVLHELFATFTKALVTHKGGRAAHNAGELSIVGTTQLLEEIGGLNEDDVFLDVGSGIGNVVAQVALQTQVRKAIGIEIRRDLALLGEKRIKAKADKYAQLTKVEIWAADVCETDLHVIQSATILFSNSKLFEPRSHLALEKTVLELPHVRNVILGAPICPRHRESCCREFCMLWKLKKKIELHVTWTATPVELLYYTKRAFEE